MGDLVLLAPREQARVDLVRLMERSAQLAVHPVTAGLDAALEDLAETLEQMTRAFRENRLDDMAQAARQAARKARALGMNRAFRVGQSIATLAESNDSAALAANVARLMRLGDSALASVWQHLDSHY